MSGETEGAHSESEKLTTPAFSVESAENGASNVETNPSSEEISSSPSVTPAKAVVPAVDVIYDAFGRPAPIASSALCALRVCFHFIVLFSHTGNIRAAVYAWHSYVDSLTTYTKLDGPQSLRARRRRQRNEEEAQNECYL